MTVLLGQTEIRKAKLAAICTIKEALESQTGGKLKDRLISALDTLRQNTQQFQYIQDGKATSQHITKLLTLCDLTWQSTKTASAGAATSQSPEPPPVPSNTIGGNGEMRRQTRAREELDQGVTEENVP